MVTSCKEAEQKTRPKTIGMQQKGGNLQGENAVVKPLSPITELEDFDFNDVPEFPMDGTLLGWDDNIESLINDTPCNNRGGKEVDSYLQGEVKKEMDLVEMNSHVCSIQICRYLYEDDDNTEIPLEFVTEGVFSEVARMMQRPPHEDFSLKETKPHLGGGKVTGDKLTSTYDLVEQMQYLYVRVVKARELPSKDVT
ncbi:hypothetical protein Tco_1064200, partial [Tanacetum coccineum]